MLFFAPGQLARMRAEFAAAGGRWPDFHEPFLLQPAPDRLGPADRIGPSYEVLRFQGADWDRVRTDDLKYASWVISGNAVAWALGGDRRHLEAGRAWVEAMLASHPSAPAPEGRHIGNCDLFFGDLAYAGSMFYDLCRADVDADLRRRLEARLAEQAEAGHAYFTKRAPDTYCLTQNHPYTAFTGYVCAALALREVRPDLAAGLDAVAALPGMIVRGLGRDGFFHEGMSYFHYSFIWVTRLAELWHLHRGEDLFHAPCFTQARHFLHWTFYPRGTEAFLIGNASEKGSAYQSWQEHLDRPGLRTDTEIQNYSHILYRVALATGDGAHRQVADAVRARGFRWNEGYWALAWGDAPGAAPAAAPGPDRHHFDDLEIWACDVPVAGDVLRVVAKNGPPAGHSLPLRDDGRPVMRTHLGHVHADAGGVWAAFGDLPVLVGPGYLSRKTGALENTISVDGEGQDDDRLWDAFGYEHADFRRLDRLRVVPEGADGRTVAMDATPAYRPGSGIAEVVRRVTCLPGHGCDIADHVALDRPRRPEARFRITDKPERIDADGIVWRVGGRRFALRIAQASVPMEVFCHPGEVIGVNMDRPGLFIEGDTHQRGFQVLFRPTARVRTASWSIALRVEG